MTNLARHVQAALDALFDAYDNTSAGERATDLQRALATIPAVRAQLDRLELLLLDAARVGHRGNAAGPPIEHRTWLTWQEAAAALDLESRQAAEQRYRRLRERHPDATLPPAPLIKTLPPALEEDTRHA